jgi:lysyl-tRNA synthetase class II
MSAKARIRKHLRLKKRIVGLWSRIERVKRVFKLFELMKEKTDATN